MFQVKKKKDASIGPCGTPLVIAAHLDAHLNGVWAGCCEVMKKLNSNLSPCCCFNLEKQNLACPTKG